MAAAWGRLKARSISPAGSAARNIGPRLLSVVASSIESISAGSKATSSSTRARAVMAGCIQYWQGQRLNAASSMIQRVPRRSVAAVVIARLVPERPPQSRRTVEDPGIPGQACRRHAHRGHGGPRMPAGVRGLRHRRRPLGTPLEGRRVDVGSREAQCLGHAGRVEVRGTSGGRRLRRADCLAPSQAGARLARWPPGAPVSPRCARRPRSRRRPRSADRRACRPATRRSPTRPPTRQRPGATSAGRSDRFHRRRARRPPGRSRRRQLEARPGLPPRSWPDRRP